jgi:hypothetical protein
MTEGAADIWRVVHATTEGNDLAVGLKHLGQLECDEATPIVAEKKVWSPGLCAPEYLIVRSEFCDTGIRVSLLSEPTTESLPAK